MVVIEVLYHTYHLGAAILALVGIFPSIIEFCFLATLSIFVPPFQGTGCVVAAAHMF